MPQISMFRFIIGMLFVLIGLAIFFIELYGVFKYDYSLNRMHAAALGDTLGLSASLIGIMIFFGFSFVTLKLILVALFLWFTSPVSSHLISALAAETDDDLDDHLTEGKLEDVLKEGKDD